MCGITNFFIVFGRLIFVRSHISKMRDLYISDLLENNLYEETFRRFLPSHSSELILFNCYKGCKFLLGHMEMLRNPNNWKGLYRICLSDSWESKFNRELKKFEQNNSSIELINLLRLMKWESLIKMTISGEYIRFVEELHTNSNSIANILKTIYSEGFH